MQEKEELTNLITKTSFDKTKEMNSSHEKKSTMNNFENKTAKINAKSPDQTRKNSTKTGSNAKKTTTSSKTKTSQTKQKEVSLDDEKTSEIDKIQTQNKSQKKTTQSSKQTNTTKQSSAKKQKIELNHLDETDSSKVSTQKSKKTNNSVQTKTTTTKTNKTNKNSTRSPKQTNTQNLSAKKTTNSTSSKKTSKSNPVTINSENSTKEKVTHTKNFSSAKATVAKTKKSGSTSQTKKKTQQKRPIKVLEKENNSSSNDEFEKTISPEKINELSLHDETTNPNQTIEIVSDNKGSEAEIDKTETTTIETQTEQPTKFEFQEKQSHENRSTIFKYLLSAMIVFGICFVTSLFTFNILLIPTEVQGFSMLPTINTSAIGEDGDTFTDIVYVSKLKKISHSDIIVIEGGKTSSGNRIIKRVIALPGDTITFKVTETRYEHFQNYFYVDIYLNGEKLEEDYTKEEQTKIMNSKESSSFYQFNNTLVSALDKNGEFSLTLGNDEYFVMGDNRNIYNSQDSKDHGSVDSRMFGTVKKDEIVGNVVFIVEYGDNLLQAIWKSLFSVRLQIF